MVHAGSGIVDVRSEYSVGETLDRLEALARTRGMSLFGRINFSGDAAGVDLSLRPMQMLLFGNPRAGTPLMVASPRAGLDLPLKALAWQDGDGTTWLSFNAPEYVGARHGLPPELVANIVGIRALVEAASQ